MRWRDDCFSCAIVRGDAPASFTHQDDSVVAFMDIQPITHGHMLVVPRAHAVLMQDVDETAAMRAFRAARHMAALARQTLGAAGAQLSVRGGEGPFWDVPPVYMHPHALYLAGRSVRWLPIIQQTA